jgi:general secretion pathway protein G
VHRVDRSQFKHEKVRPNGFTLLELLLAITILGLLIAVAIPSYEGYMQRSRIAAALTDMGTLQIRIENFRTVNGMLPANLDALGAPVDPWGNPYRYLNIEAGVNRGAVRKNRNLVPINTDYDLYSAGEDGESRPPLTARPSRDDVVRANNGRYFGLAEDY